MILEVEIYRNGRLESIDGVYYVERRYVSDSSVGSCDILVYKGRLIAGIYIMSGLYESMYGFIESMLSVRRYSVSKGISTIIMPNVSNFLIREMLDVMFENTGINLNYKELC